MDAGAAIAEAERVTLEGALLDLGQRREKAIQLNVRDRISDSELDELLDQILRERSGVEQRLRDIEVGPCESEPPLDPDLLTELRRRLDEGLDDVQRQEIVRLLVKRIMVHTALLPEGDKGLRVVIEYRFPGVVNFSTDRGS